MAIYRCFDCFDEIRGERYAVLKQLREWPKDTDPIEARRLLGVLYNPVLVCPDCAGWYGDGAYALEEGEEL